MHEYTAGQVKQAVVGRGRALKPQVQEMVRRLLKLPGAPSPDAADALACAICHAHGSVGTRRVCAAPATRMRARTAPPMRAPRPARRPLAVIFDMDGLMLDTEPLGAARPWRDAATAARHRVRLPLLRRDDRPQFPRLPRDAARAPRRGVPGRRNCTAAWHVAYDAIVEREGIALKQGLHRLLDWLERRTIPRPSRRRRAATAPTRSSRSSASSRAFAALVGGDEIVRGKPAPDIFLVAAQRLGVTAADCLVLEDSEPGVRAALAAGMMPIMVPDLHAPSADLLARESLVLPIAA